MNTPAWNDGLAAEVQTLALSGHDTDFAHHFVLTVTHAARAREFVAGLLADGWVSFGDTSRAQLAQRGCVISLGFTYLGLQVLGVSDRVLDILAQKSPAFAEDALRRATRRLGDGGPSAPECWEPVFRSGQTHVWLTAHGDNGAQLDRLVAALPQRSGADGLDGWHTEAPLRAQALQPGQAPGNRNRTVHFDFRDNLSRPGILAKSGGQQHPAGELLLGYLNAEKFDFWTAEQSTPADVAGFLRNGSFGVLRKIEQDEAAFNRYLDEQVAALAPQYPFVSPVYLKAKMCGRWPNGARVEPGQTTEPANPAPALMSGDFDFAHDLEGKGCPFGSHIRRTNPRNDLIEPPRKRPLFRRGMTYGPSFAAAPAVKERGLMGAFFCASIDDQFETVMSEWVEKNPMGPANRGRSKDPLVGQHDDPDTEFHIPQPSGPPIVLKNMQAFMTTKGTLYALFPSRQALLSLSAAMSPARQAARAAAALPVGAPGGVSPGVSGPAAAARVTPNPAAEASVDDDTQALRRRAPSDRFCDIVMEGGITSGIIYASAVVGLSREYRFKNIAGSSIGAFAAAVTAAAEYRRRAGSDEGFDKLSKLPDKLAEEDDSGRTRLERMFIPQPGTRRLYEVFLATLNRGSGTSRVLGAVVAALRQYAGLVAVVALLLGAIVLAGPLLAWAQFSSYGDRFYGALSWAGVTLGMLGVSVFAGIAAGLVWDIACGLVPNGFGLCRGWSETDSFSSPDLAGFLHGSIQTLAGRHPIDARPLTFRDLWDAPGGPTEVLGYRASEVAARSINLEIYSANLAHGRPYRFPLEEDEDMGRLFFRIDDLAPYFPKPVLMHLQAFSKPYAPKSTSDPVVDDQYTSGYRELPAGDLPIVVAVRLAMSFPGLISAVPLWAMDHEPPQRKDRRFARCWMSDGGLCSNFPIHLFDSVLPKWPTFGISLQTRSDRRPGEEVWLPDGHMQGRGETWDHGPDRARSALGRLGAFLVSIWLTTWRWNDSTMMRMPGVRDRVVRVYLLEDEGGVNIRMTAQQIRNLAETYGKQAAARFIAKFARPGSTGWAEHRWVRFNSMLVALRQRIEGIGAAARMDHHTVPLAEQIEDAKTTAPLRVPPKARPRPSEEPVRPESAKELAALLEGLEAMEDLFNWVGDTQPYDALPRPSLRVRHPT
ncbi:hypothetical protein ACVNIS_00965 [Sphaerotilaceae bacterium SBD11-9]